MKNPVVVWFRSDLRVSDNPALVAAIATGQPVIALYVLEQEGVRKMGAASRYWLHHSLAALQLDLCALGGTLIIRRGSAQSVLKTLIENQNVTRVFWNRRYDKDGLATDTKIKAMLKADSLSVESFNGNLLTEPWKIQKKTGGYYKVFTPYWRAACAHIKNYSHRVEPFGTPQRIENFDDLSSLSLEDLDLLPRHPAWGSKMDPYWSPGSEGARKALKRFLDGPVETYTDDRNRPDIEGGTSKLSPHLAFGEISPRQIWAACQAADPENGVSGRAAKFLSEIGWREFSYGLLFHNPDLATKNFKPEFDSFEWEDNLDALALWQKGQTGYPLVDAGMRQLWQTGWQHNRVRMVTASFLIKHLLIDWRLGERWFWDTLVDADPASNAASWQWVAGSGADASPYFRIFNPFTQGEKFDPNGDYVRKFIPELKGLPKKYIHRPWEAPKPILAQAGVTLGKTYPLPLVDHKTAREKALSVYKHSRQAGLLS